MSDKPFDAEAHVAHMATVMQLTIDPAWVPAVVQNVTTTAALAALVLEFPLDDQIEPATKFEA